MPADDAFPIRRSLRVAGMTPLRPAREFIAHNNLRLEEEGNRRANGTPTKGRSVHNGITTIRDYHLNLPSDLSITDFPGDTPTARFHQPLLGSIFIPAADEPLVHYHGSVQGTFLHSPPKSAQVKETISGHGKMAKPKSPAKSIMSFQNSPLKRRVAITHHAASNQHNAQTGRNRSVEDSDVASTNSKSLQRQIKGNENESSIPSTVRARRVHGENSNIFLNSKADNLLLSSGKVYYFDFVKAKFRFAACLLSTILRNLIVILIVIFMLWPFTVWIFNVFFTVEKDLNFNQMDVAGAPVPEELNSKLTFTEMQIVNDNFLAIKDQILQLEEVIYRIDSSVKDHSKSLTMRHNVIDSEIVRLERSLETLANKSDNMFSFVSENIEKLESKLDDDFVKNVLNAEIEKNLAARSALDLGKSDAIHLDSSIMDLIEEKVESLISSYKAHFVCNSLETAEDAKVYNNVLNLSDEIKKLRVSLEMDFAAIFARKSDVATIASKLFDDKIFKALEVVRPVYIAECLESVKEKMHLNEPFCNDESHLNTNDFVKDAEDLPSFSDDLVDKKLYRADANSNGNVEMIDFASLHMNSRPIISRSSLTFEYSPRWSSIFSFRSRKKGRSHHVALSDDNSIGNCWAFNGHIGHLTISLGTPVIATHFSMYHIPQSVSTDRSSAPKEFRVLALNSLDESAVVVVGHYEYDLHNPDPLQIFESTVITPNPVRFYRLEILSNHGKRDFTCLYSFKIHSTHTLLSNHKFLPDQ